MSKLWKVAWHEFRRTAGTKAFVVLTILGPFLIIAMTVVPAVVSQRQQRKQLAIAVTGADPAMISRVAPPLEEAGILLETVGGPDPGVELDARLLQGGLYGYLIFPGDILTEGSLELVTREFPDFRVVELLKKTIGGEVIDARMRQAGMDPVRIRQLTQPVQLKTRQITKSGEKVQQDQFSFIMVGIAFTLMLYMTILLYGQAIGRSVVQEKTSKTVEIMLSSVSERDLLFGKILGQTAASLLQYAVWVGMALIGVELIGPRLGLARLPQLSAVILLYLVVFFLMGFLLYAAFYAALGAASEDEQNLGQLSWPLIVFLVFPMVSAGPIITNPGSSFSLFLSLFPLTAPVVMFVRIMASEPPGWQILLSLGILGVSVAVTMLFSARIFRVGILMTGKRFRLPEIVRWIRR
jgi:ABC-2 type transport system permease protein